MGWKRNRQHGEFLPKKKRKIRSLGREELIICPPSSKKKYKAVQLKNGLRALLVSDPDVTVAAVSMSIRVGYFLDPPEAQGLCHLLGSSAYPGKNDFLDYLTLHGGNSNAETLIDYSRFYMHVDPDFLKGALKRFSEMFISPLLELESIEKEILGVDSEFETRNTVDRNRHEQLKSHTSGNGQPYQRFGSGNKKSLCNVTIVDLQKLMKKFFDQHYHGSAMKLCILGGESLSELESWIKKYICGVKESSEPITTVFNLPKPIWDASTLYISEGVEGRNVLMLSWMIPPLTETCYMEKPELYPLILLDKASKGSVYAILGDKGWVTMSGLRVIQVTDLEIVYLASSCLSLHWAWKRSTK
ncbi:Nardilysin-like [Cardamine amara subsp. amara]|uniref:Nardilysin-like n=1 Tax=Cardamine amara subsp. amara TaxID=228776 RepID=A0ABD1B513_CARAN